MALEQQLLGWMRQHPQWRTSGELVTIFANDFNVHYALGTLRAARHVDSAITPDGVKYHISLKGMRHLRAIELARLPRCTLFEYAHALKTRVPKSFAYATTDDLINNILSVELPDKTENKS